MKPLLLILTLLYTALTAFGQQPEYPDSGFTNKAEAKNLIVNGKKEGKWIEYMEEGYRDTQDTAAFYYTCTIYKEGKPYGIQRVYYRSGKIRFEYPYVSGRLNGMVKVFYESGVLYEEISHKDGMKNGIWKEYYENGKPYSEAPYANDLPSKLPKKYNEDGAEIKW